MASALISTAEQAYIRQGVVEGIRGDGRGRADYRDYLLSVNVISHSSGSARCRVGFGTDVLVGVKAEVAMIEPGEAPNRGRVQCHVECSPSAARQFQARLTDELNNDLTQFLTRALNDFGGIDLDKLAIIPNQACWVLYIDAMILDFDGNVHDTLLIATRAALANTRIPKVEVQALEDGQQEYDVIDDPEAATPVPGWEDAPLCVTLNWTGDGYVADATHQEELCTDAKLMVCVNRHGDICSMQKSTLGTIPQATFLEMLENATKIAAQIIPTVDQRLKEEHERTAQQVSGGHKSTFMTNTFL